jgi:pyruvate dehydrogenase E2 component (dihydrolipoamide acetyltransferase)
MTLTMTEISMPQLSDSMQEGTILRWLIADGAPVARGQELLEIETDKATMTYESDVDGVIEVVVLEGSTVPVGEVIARVSDGLEPSDPNQVAGELAASGRAVRSAAPCNGGGGADHAQARTVSVLATPVARRVAKAHDVALADVTGTGPRGRITKADVALAAGTEAPTRRRGATVAPPAEPSPVPSVAAQTGATGTLTVHELSRLQQLIARRMTQAKATVPHFQVQTDAVMDGVALLRAQLKLAAGPGTVVPSLNDIVIKACAIALRQHPRVNGSYEDGRFELHSRVNIGFAVAADDALIVPTLFDADTKSLGTIASESRNLAERVRSGAITPPELSGGTFTVSNLGTYGMTAITPVINPPQAAILGVGAVRDMLARVDGEIVDRAVITLTLSCDHRILYGADAARFLAEIKDLLQAPLRILL